MERSDLHYTEHDCNNGQIFLICPIEDCSPNEGGLYCEIYVNDYTEDPIDNFVIHNGEDPTIVAIDYMDKYYPKVLQFDDLNADQLWRLRKEINLNSLYHSDYHNSFGFDAKDVSYFFDGYVEYLGELADEKGGSWIDYDSKENLHQWYDCCEDYAWIKQTIKY